MRMDVVNDPIVGVVRSFRDSWRNRPAMCHLVGEGSGPQQESVRIVGKPVRGGGFTAFYVISYDCGQGNARRAYEYLAKIYQGPVRAKEVRSEEGIGFHRAMMEAGIVSEMDVDLYEMPSARP